MSASRGPLTTAKREQNTAADATASSSSTPALRRPTSRSARCSSCSRSFSPRSAHPLAPGFLTPPRDEPAPAREPASTPPPVSDDGLGDLDLGLELEGKSGASKSCCSLLIDMCVQIAADRFVQREMRLRGLVIS